jgi:hypothetical protein
MTITWITISRGQKVTTAMISVLTIARINGERERESRKLSRYYPMRDVTNARPPHEYIGIIG